MNMLLAEKGSDIKYQSLTGVRTQESATGLPDILKAVSCQNLCCARANPKRPGKPSTTGRLAAFQAFEQGLKNLLAEIYEPSLPFTQTEIEEHCSLCPFKTIAIRRRRRRGGKQNPHCFNEMGMLI